MQQPLKDKVAQEQGGTRHDAAATIHRAIALEVAFP